MYYVLWVFLRRKHNPSVDLYSCLRNHKVFRLKSLKVKMFSLWNVPLVALRRTVCRLMNKDNAMNPENFSILNGQRRTPCALGWDDGFPSSFTPRSVLLERINNKFALPVDMPCCCQYHSCIDCSCGKCFDPNRLAQGILASSAFQSTPLLSGIKWPLPWFLHSCFCNLLVIHGVATEVAILPVRVSRVRYNSRFFIWSVFVHNNFYKRGQTSRFVARTQVQTNCNCQASICNYCRHLGFSHSRHRSWVLHLGWEENFCILLYNAVSDTGHVLLFENLLEAPSSSDSSSAKQFVNSH